MHSKWYYNSYEKIFGWSRNYSAEIAMINDIISFKDKIVEEIGAGTGEHTEEIFKYNPSKIRAIDIDIQAIELLKNRFINEKNLEIIEGDGFVRKSYADVILCLYSILQQTEKEDVLMQRIENLIYRVCEYKCDAFVECIDTEKHNPHGFIPIFENKKEYVGIKSKKTRYGIQIIYEGHLDNIDISYKIPIINCPLYIFEIDKNIHCDVIPLTASGRKRILHIYRRI